MQYTERNYPAKLLLFGEHLLLRGSTALAVPVSNYFGRWAIADLNNQPDNWHKLRGFAMSLPADWPELAVDRLREDVERGWYFESNIPQGYGLGSSGALCAALYERYGMASNTTDLGVLKAILGRIESQFHGQSSGIDPLTSLLSTPLLIQQQTRVQQTVTPQWTGAAAPVVFLIDTLQPRQTGPLVHWFLEQSSVPGPFLTMLEQIMYPAHEAMLTAWLAADPAFWQYLRIISALQRQWFTPMLPQHDTLLEWWSTCLDQPHTALKICGAGGGGFLLGFTTDPDFVTRFAHRHGFPVTFPFAVSG